METCEQWVPKLRAILAQHVRMRRYILIFVGVVLIALALLPSREGFQQPMFNSTAAKTLVDNAQVYARNYPNDSVGVAYATAVHPLYEEVVKFSNPMTMAGTWAGGLEMLVPPADLLSEYNTSLATTFGFPVPAGAPGTDCTPSRPRGSTTVAPSPAMCQYFCASGMAAPDSSVCA
jgi:hypothetical protein